MLRYMRMGDGMLARFNGMSIPSAAGLGTVLGYDDGSAAKIAEARASGYARLERSGTVVLVDVGTPPPLSAAGEAQAGALSFEISSGPRLIFINGGMPGPAGSDWNAAARATASHNTLRLAEKSSSQLVPHRRLEAQLGSAPIRLPDRVDWHMEAAADGLLLEATHDGYHRRFNLVHTRRLMLSTDGERLDGHDILDGMRQKVRLKTELPFSIHFHLHPEVSCRLGAGAMEAQLKLADGQRWRFSAGGKPVSVEESTFFANSTGPRTALQLVLRSVTFGESEISWSLERVRDEEAK
jgi:uncharacterized heparinase superfamily protein